MPITWVPCEEYIYHAGVTLYRTYQFGRLSQPNPNRFTVLKDDDEGDIAGFNVYDLPFVRHIPHIVDKTVRAAEVYRTLTEEERIRVLFMAIDLGIVTAEGYDVATADAYRSVIDEDPQSWISQHWDIT